MKKLVIALISILICICCDKQGTSDPILEYEISYKDCYSNENTFYFFSGTEAKLAFPEKVTDKNTGKSYFISKMTYSENIYENGDVSNFPTQSLNLPNSFTFDKSCLSGKKFEQKFTAQVTIEGSSYYFSFDIICDVVSDLDDIPSTAQKNKEGVCKLTLSTRDSL